MRDVNSQRTDGFISGIQPGMTTYDRRTKKVDSYTKMASRELADDPDIKNANVIFTSAFTQDELGGKGGKQAAYPDGGVWRKVADDKLTIVGIIEAKKQGISGNAIERWYANNDYLTYNKGTKSLTFLTGDGVKENGTMHREFVGKLLREGKTANSFNVFHKTGCSFFTSERGFTYQEIKAIMKQWLLM